MFQRVSLELVVLAAAIDRRLGAVAWSRGGGGRGFGFAPRLRRLSDRLERLSRRRPRGPKVFLDIVEHVLMEWSGWKGDYDLQVRRMDIGGRS